MQLDNDFLVIWVVERFQGLRSLLGWLLFCNEVEGGASGVVCGGGHASGRFDGFAGTDLEGAGGTESMSISSQARTRPSASRD